MLKTIKTYSILLLLFCAPTILAPVSADISHHTKNRSTPTENLLTQVSEDEIAEIISSDMFGTQQSFDFNHYAEFFHQIIAHENDDLIGYHATTIDHYIFQEFVRAILEVKHGWEIPEDFYFMRVPGEQEYNINGVKDIYERFGRPDFSTSELKDVIVALMDDPIHYLSGHHLNWENTTDEEFDELYNLFLHFAMNLPNTNMSLNDAKNELIQILNEKFPSSLSESEFVNLQKAIVKFAKNPKGDKFRSIYPSWLPFDKINCPFDDTEEELQNLIIALNISLYGNFFISSESTLHIFANNKSVEVDEDKHPYDRFFLDKQDSFFKGLTENQVDHVYSWAKTHFPSDIGVILQFFLDHSKYSSQLENIFYTCGFFGAPLIDRSVKECVKDGKGEWIFFPHFNKKLLINNQLRLILTNDFSLNPFSGLKVKQHDLINPELKRELRERIRNAVR